LALSAVSAGQSDIFADSRIHLWDVVTGYLLVKEAGGIVQSWSGKTSLKDIVKEGSFLATTMELRDEVVKFLPKVKKNLQKK
jgi:fructose-1,6-bisphosphatase/inositol monophosphatase family enzyme